MSPALRMHAYAPTHNRASILSVNPSYQLTVPFVSMNNLNFKLGLAVLGKFGSVPWEFSSTKRTFFLHCEGT